MSPTLKAGRCETASEDREPLLLTDVLQPVTNARFLADGDRLEASGGSKAGCGGRE